MWFTSLGEQPPVKGFRSLTMYDTEAFFVTNPLDRVNLSQRSKFTFNEDGSLDLYIQKDSPGKEKEANWLPSPEGNFGLFLRLCWPNEKAPSILDQTPVSGRYCVSDRWIEISMEREMARLQCRKPRGGGIWWCSHGGGIETSPQGEMQINAI
jgi:hypothetical protein